MILGLTAGSQAVRDVLLYITDRRRSAPTEVDPPRFDLVVADASEALYQGFILLGTRPSAARARRTVYRPFTPLSNQAAEVR
ncbi:MAG TPA: hypothetical protein VFQ76_06310 [Longimicrobiaceae bacterium]|nr:hypothetical protein [Longimicrobiaceae bacterium]